MQEFDMETADLRRGVSMKSCIFKEGDDLRQDILALQIIEFFLKVGAGYSTPEVYKISCAEVDWI